MKFAKVSTHWLNKYSLTIIAFILWIALLDGKYSWVKQYKLRRHLNEMLDSKVEYAEKLKVAKKDYEKLVSNKEKYAREKYFVSKHNEDVYIIE